MDQNAQNQITRRIGASQPLLCIALFLATTVAWAAPAPKADAVAARYTYAQIATAGLLTALTASVSLVTVWPAGGRKKTSFRLLAVWLAVGGIVMACELGAYLLPTQPQSKNSWYTALSLAGSRDLPYERKPNLNWYGLATGDLALDHGLADPYARMVRFKTDGEGFRNNEEILQARLVFLGDSYTEAGNVPEEDTFVRRTARALKSSGRNLGRAGYSPQAELIVLKKFGLKCQPKTVVWQFCENDLDDSVAFHRWVAVGQPYWDYPDREPRSEAWRRRSPSYILFTRMQTRRPALTGSFRDADATRHLIRFGHFPDTSNQPDGHEGWPYMQATIRQGAALLFERGIRLVILFIPIKYDIYGPLVDLDEFTQSHRPEHPDARNRLAPHLAAFVQEAGILFVDPTVALRQAAANGQLVYPPNDVHLSEAGHAIVSRLLVDAL